MKTSLKLPANSPAGFAFVNPKPVPLRFHNLRTLNLEKPNFLFYSPVPTSPRLASFPGTGNEATPRLIDHLLKQHGLLAKVPTGSLITSVQV